MTWELVYTDTNVNPAWIIFFYLATLPCPKILVTLSSIYPKNIISFWSRPLFPVLLSRQRL